MSESKIKAGDRVRSRYAEGYGTVLKYNEASGEPGTLDCVRVAWDNSLISSIAVASVELVEVAHYFNPGTTVVEVTPELRDAINLVARFVGKIAPSEDNYVWDALEKYAAPGVPIVALTPEFARGEAGEREHCDRCGPEDQECSEAYHLCSKCKSPTVARSEAVQA